MEKKRCWKLKTEELEKKKKNEKDNIEKERY